MTFRAGLLSALLLVAALPLAAHHSAAAEYESKLGTVTGTVIQFQWSNPHVYIYLNSDGRRLVCEANGPGALVESGWRKDTLKPGDKITVEGYRAKYRPDGFKVHVVTLASGQRLMVE